MAHVHGTRYSFYHQVLIKFYCDVTNSSRLQLINTLIDTLFSQLCAFLVEQKRRRKVMVAKRKLDGAVDVLSADQKIHKSNVTVHNLWKIWKLAPTVLLKGNVANMCNFFAIYECVSSLTIAFWVCGLV